MCTLLKNGNNAYGRTKLRKTSSDRSCGEIRTDYTTRNSRDRDSPLFETGVKNDHRHKFESCHHVQSSNLSLASRLRQQLLPFAIARAPASSRRSPSFPMFPATSSQRPRAPRIAFWAPFPCTSPTPSVLQTHGLAQQRRPSSFGPENFKLNDTAKRSMGTHTSPSSDI